MHHQMYAEGIAHELYHKGLGKGEYDAIDILLID